MRQGDDDDAAAGAAWKAVEGMSGFSLRKDEGGGGFDPGDLPGTCNCPSAAPGYSD